ncbi:MAG: AAA family ATPase [Anaerolineae bacterium]|nr:MAG: ATPase AAA [Chloroflexi bacterium OLB13]MBW7879825.1 AAA family ATPase [Anaerolineae bacterium]
MTDPTRLHVQPPPAITSDASALETVLLRVRLLAERRLSWLEQRRGTVNGTPAPSEIDALLGDMDDPAAEREFHAAQPSLSARIEAIERALDADRDSRLAALIRVFGLDALDRDVLHVCLAAAADPGLARLFAYLHDDSTRPYPTLGMIARLCGHGRFMALPATSPLRRWRMIGMGSDPAGDSFAPLRLDPVIRDALAGQDDLDPALTGHARLIAPLEPLPEWDVDGEAAFASRALTDQPGRTVVLHVVAPKRSGRKTFAACVSAHVGMPLLAVDVSGILDDQWETAFIHAQRHAFLNRCALAWTSRAPGLLARAWPNSVPHFPLQFVLREALDNAPLIDDALERRIELPAPATDTRLKLWRTAAPQVAAANPDSLIALAGRFNARPGDIAEAAGIPFASAELMAHALRDRQRGLFGGLAQPLECPFVWDDLVVSPALRDALTDFVHEAGDRAAFWEQPGARRLFPQGRGLAALFTGSPGTGKTMAAQVMAAALGLDLFRVDLSSVVSKYVGETSQHLQRILTRAAEMDAVLFFDEADALFSRRTDVKDAHDRFANTDTNHLLQALENYDGIAVLATNRKGNIDPAFVRRLRYVLDFPKPDAAQRHTLWTRLIHGLAGDHAVRALGGLIDKLAAELELTGAQIKYAVLTAVFAARRDGTPIAADHILRGLDREMAKEGRALSDRERLRLG